MAVPQAVGEVVVVVDDGEKSYGIVVGKKIYVDGVEMLLPKEAVVRTECGGNDALTVSLTFFASSVRYVPEEK